MASPIQDPGLSSKPYIDPTPLPADVPKVNELGTTSAPLKSAAFFIGAYCKDYNEDFMLCKAEDRDPAHCLKEGRRVTRCATDLITKMRENCLKEFDAHWQCLENNNQEYYHCRKPERTLNKCMFEKLGLVKTIPGTSEGKTPIHLVEKPIFKSIQKVFTGDFDKLRPELLNEMTSIRVPLDYTAWPTTESYDSIEKYKEGSPEFIRCGTGPTRPSQMILRHFPIFRFQWNPTRSSHSLIDNALRPTHSIYVSRSTNPYFNLSLEDWLFRRKNHQEPLLLIYRDDPCVVIGRNQNPWKEVNLELAAEKGIPFIRRRSGGGTVYHDTGNTNYSIHLPRSSFDRKTTANIVVQAVRSLGIDAKVNDRNDICAAGYKISSAYKIVNNRAYHHGTMLISTKLDALGKLLHTTKETLITKGVASVRSPVSNLQELDPRITHDSFVDAIVSSFRAEYNIDEEPNYVEEDYDGLDNHAIRGGMDELKTWDWRYGQTPEFTYTFSQVFEWGETTAEIMSKHGLILSCKLDCTGLHSKLLQPFERAIEGQRYGFLHEINHHDLGIGSYANEEEAQIRGLWQWVSKETSF